MFTSKIARIFLCMALLGFSVSAVAGKLQTRDQVNRQTKEQLEKKASKVARKEAKRLKKEGWTVVPGALPLDKQLDRAYFLQLEIGDDMLPKYIMGEAMSVGENYDAAKVQAFELAKQNLVAQIESEITAMVESTVANQQLSVNDAASIAKTVVESRNTIVKRIGRVLTAVEAYRTLPNGNKEVLVRVAYSMESALQVVKETIREEWQNESPEKKAAIDMLFKQKI